MKKKLSKLKDELTQQRRNLPWLKMKYFNITNEKGTVPFKSLFGDKKQLCVYNMMSFQKGYPCPACSMIAEQLNTVTPALLNHTAVAVLSRAPFERLQACAKLRKWIVPVASVEKDYTVWLRTEEVPECEKYLSANGPTARPTMSVYALGDDNEIYLTYVSHERGVEEVESYLGWVDRLPFVAEGVRQPAFLKWKELHGEDPMTATATNGTAATSDASCGCDK